MMNNNEHKFAQPDSQQCTYLSMCLNLIRNDEQQQDGCQKWLAKINISKKTVECNFVYFCLTEQFDKINLVYSKRSIIIL